MESKAVVLLVEDNRDILEANKRIFTKAGYTVHTAETLAGARAALRDTPPDAIVLDIMLPDGNGLDFIEEIRSVSVAPVLLLTSLTEPDERLAGLRAGGDDYITKPYNIEELRERVAGFLRRDEMLRRNPPQSITRGPLTLNLVARRAYLNGEDMALFLKEYDLLLLLLRNEGKTLTSKYLYETAWAMPYHDNGGALWAQLSRLKKKLESCDSVIELTAVRGEGFAQLS